MPGVALKTVKITAGGTLYNDRRWALVDKNKRLINGKNNKRVFLLRPTFDLGAETVAFPDTDEVFSLGDTDGLSAYFSEQLGQPVFMQEDKRQGFPDDMTASGPTVISQASLQAVSSWFPNLSLDDIRARFRVNLEVSPAPAFWEDRLFKQSESAKIIQIGTVSLYSSNPCARCSVPIKNPESGIAYEGFYETFIDKRFRNKPSWADAICFDHWYRLSVNTNIQAVEAGKSLALGDAVSIRSQ
jgi:uncharacterized protein YcbX